MRSLRDWFLRGPVVVTAGALVLAACGGGSGAVSEESVVSRLQSQGFQVVSDGRGSEAATALRYAGSPAAVVTCSGSGWPASQEVEIASADGRVRGEQRGRVDAWVIVDNDGSESGLYINHITRDILAPSGDIAAREVETIRFEPGSAGRFRNGATCRART